MQPCILGFGSHCSSTLTSSLPYTFHLLIHPPESSSKKFLKDTASVPLSYSRGNTPHAMTEEQVEKGSFLGQSGTALRVAQSSI